MTTLHNGSPDDTHTTASVDREPPGTFQMVARTIWTTVYSTTFAVGAAVGATLMYAGIRVAQAYLSAEQDTDQPF